MATAPKTATGKAAGGAEPPGDRRLAYLTLDQVTIAEGFNPRSDGWQGDGLKELTASVKSHGVLQPILVREHVGEGYFTVVAGHRRLAAAKAAGLSEIPALIGEHATDPQGAHVAALVENVQREDLEPVDQARAIAELLDSGLTQVDVAKVMGKSERWVRERLRILKLPPKVQAAIAAGTVPTTGARVLEQIAEHAPAAAELVAQLLAEGEFPPKELIESPGMVLSMALDSLETDETPPLVELHASGVDLTMLPIDPAVREDLVKRLKAAHKRNPRLSAGGRPWASWPHDPSGAGVAEIARKAGKLLILEDTSGIGQPRKSHYVADVELLTSLATQAVEGDEREADTAVKKAEAEAKKPKPKDSDEARQARDVERKAAGAALAAKARPHAAQMNRLLGRKLAGMTSIEITGVPAQLLLELAAGRGDTGLAYKIEQGLALCDEAYAGQGQQAVIERVVGESDPGKAAAFIVGAEIAYVYADRRADKGYSDTGAGRGIGYRIGVAQANPVLALVRAAAAALKVLPGTRPDEYLAALGELAQACDYHDREGTRRRLLFELSEAKSGLLEPDLRTKAGAYRYDISHKVEADVQVYGPNGVPRALGELLEAGQITTDESEKTEGVVQRRHKITKAGKAYLNTWAPPAPMIRDIDPDDPPADAGQEA